MRCKDTDVVRLRSAWLRDHPPAGYPGKWLAGASGALGAWIVAQYPSLDRASGWGS